MDEPTSVACVLLVATDARARALAPWFTVDGEPVRYTLDTMSPAEASMSVASSIRAWDLIVLDGESVGDDALRDQLFAELRAHRGGLVTLLFVCTPRPSSAELRQALGWADDHLTQGWEFGLHLRRRVQSVALAPWRRSLALRVEAELRGDRRLRLVHRR